MDALAGLLDGPRARGAFLLRMVMEPPWSVRIEDRAPLCLMSMTEGEAWIVPADDAEPVLLRPGDLAIARGPEPYTVADRPGTRPRTRIGPGGVCTTLRGEPLAQSMHLGVRTWGNAPDGEASMLVGTYLLDGEISRRLLDALPALILLPGDGDGDGDGDGVGVGDGRGNPLLTLLDREIARDEPGQSVVLDRLLDLLLIDALRTWFSRPGAEAPAWYRAMGDPVVGQALRLLQNEPAHPWTVAALADRTGVSRAGLARRFTELVGEPPMAYLTGWRLAVAADLLRETEATVEAVARKVGYSQAFAFSTAFKRVRGVGPQDYRNGRDLPDRQQSLPVT
ncbi:AraC family transcriptional regulator [Streptomyces sp. DT9]